MRATLGLMHERARRFAGGLKRMGVTPGDTVSFQLPNVEEAAVCFWGAALAGATMVPIVHVYGPREVDFILRQTGAKLHVTCARWGSIDYGEMLAEIRPGLPELETVVHVGDEFQQLEEGPALECPAEVDPDSPVVIAFTSGTTADPKGVIHTHRTMLGEAHQRFIELDHSKRQCLVPPGAKDPLIVSPVGHVTGMFGGLFVTLLAGRSIHMLDRWSIDTALRVLADGDLSIASGATTFLLGLLESPAFDAASAAQLRYFGLGGAPIPRAVVERAAELGITIVRTYGSTEQPTITGSSFGDPAPKRQTTEGSPLPGVEIRVVDVDGRPLPAGEPGQILTRGPDLCAGYTDPSLNSAFDEDGWFHTGDVGIIDANDCLTITDRIKDIIIRGGENISAAEVEQVLAAMPGIAEVAVVAAPDERLGEHACAFIRLATGAPELSLSEVRTHLSAAGLAKQKWPEDLRFVDDFERTGSGKVKKQVLRGLAGK
jgi:acyl-CoA synthetase (AMP-forming)/AMP-acid ligase II